MKRTVTIIIIAISVIGLSALFIYMFRGPSTRPNEPRTVHVGIGTWAGFATGMVGMEHNVFDGLNVETKILDDNAARHSAFQSGAIDIMISSIDVFAQEAAQGIKGKVFLITDESWGGDGIVTKKEIAKPGDLRGKKVAYARGTPSHYLLYKVLQANGLTLSDIEHVRVDDPGRAGDVFLSGDVAAAVTWEPFLSKVAESGKGHVLATTKDYPEIIVDILVASPELVKDTEALRLFIEGWLKSVDYIDSHPDEAVTIMAKGLNLPLEDVQGMMMGLKFADHERNRYFFDSTQPKNTRMAKLLDEAGNYWKSVGIVKEPVAGASRVSQVASQYFSKKWED